jgi:hypothetical protein
VSGSTFTRRQLEEALAFAERVAQVGQLLVDADPPLVRAEGVTDEVESLEEAEAFDAARADLAQLVVDAKLRADKLRAWLKAPAAFADPGPQ